MNHESALQVKHFDAFKNCYSNDPSGDEQGAFGYAPVEWATWVSRNGGDIDQGTLSALPQATVTRDELKRWARDEAMPLEVVVVSILAWGFMKRTHASSLFSKKHEGWMEVCAALRSGRLNRQQAYDEFLALRRSEKLPGMGPAYFTKLIFFLGENHDGYIMDQWTAASVNLLYSPKLVDRTSAHYVTDRNSSAVYERFCILIEDLARRLGIAPDVAELRLFARGGRYKHPWRKYVIEHR